MKKRLLALLLSATMLTALTATACNNDGNSSEEETSAADSISEAEPVTIKMFSNLPDRTSDQGLIEQTLFDQYMEENTNVTIEVEALDDEDYKTKFKAYASGSEMPDLVSAWGQPSFLSEPVAAGLLAELNPDDYADYGFLPGALNAHTIDGKLYGLPRNTDVMGFYYNKEMFEANGWSVPTTYDELIALAAKAKDAGVAAVAMDGGDKWPLSIYLHDLMVKVEGSGVNDTINNSLSTGDFSSETYAEAIELLQKATDAGLFQTGFETADYGTAMSLFTTGEAAMFYMGGWEMAMATNDEISFKDSIGVFMMPTVDGGAGAQTDIMAWNGGGYAVTANSAVKDEALKLLNWMFLPENWTKLAWEKGVCMSAQDFSAYLTGNETDLQTAFTDIVSGATSISSTTFNDRGNAEFKDVFEQLSQDVATKSKSADDFASELAALF